MIDEFSHIACLATYTFQRAIDNKGAGQTALMLLLFAIEDLT